MPRNKFRILSSSMSTILAVVLTFLLMMTGNYGFLYAMATHSILAKILIDKSIQELQNGNRTMTIEYLIVANRGLAGMLDSEDSSVVTEPRFIVEYLVQLMLQNDTSGITNNNDYL